MQTRRQQRHLDGNDAQLPLFGLPRVTADADDVPSAQLVVYGHKGLL